MLNSSKRNQIKVSSVFRAEKIGGWSPDSKVVFYSDGMNMMKVPIDGIATTTKLKKLDGGGADFTVSRDNKWIIYDNNGDKHGGELVNIFKQPMPL